MSVRDKSPHEYPLFEARGTKKLLIGGVGLIEVEYVVAVHPPVTVNALTSWLETAPVSR